jgi:hypothetical protein
MAVISRSAGEGLREEFAFEAVSSRTTARPMEDMLIPVADAQS